jgi:3-hydroxyisobutyrate dehydrogenase-like beta-hydroxyacid dehydrogenase
MTDGATLGFVGLGVMGEPMCRNLAANSGHDVLAYDRRAEPLDRLAAHGVAATGSLEDLIARSDIVFLSLPGGDELEEVVSDVLTHGRAGQTVIDHTTAPVGLTRTLAARLAEASIDFLDAPVARTRAAAQEGALSIMVGGDEGTFDRVRPLLACMGTDITYCGAVGCGQIVKLLNNMVLIQTVVALADALTIGRRAGLDGAVLFETLAKGSADSFALRNHGMKALLPGDFPVPAFSTEYALKDLTYALDLAREAGVDAAAAKAAERLLRETIQAGFGENYFPSLINVIDKNTETKD